MRRVLAFMLIVVAACGGQATPTTLDLPDNIREQLHAATGHEPDDCTDLRGSSAVIEITVDGIVPECAILSKEQGVLVRNTQPDDDTWIMADPGDNLVLRHIRLLLEIPAGAETQSQSERAGYWAPSGVWPCYSRESRQPCQVVLVP